MTQPHPHQPPPAWLTWLLALSCGLIVANLYYAQPLIGPISQALGIAPQAAGLIVTMTQIGYGVGLLLVVPMGDLFENRALVVTVSGLGVVALLACATLTSPGPFMAASLAIGLGSVAVQILVPYASHLAPPEQRGRMVGNVMSGLMMGIMLARPVASFIADLASWRAVYWVSAAMVTTLLAVLWRVLPRRHPPAGLSYGALLASMGSLMLTFAVLRRRAFYQACLFGAFSLFWTTVPLALLGPDFALSHSQVALFALVGVSGVAAAPIAGRLADRGLTVPASAAAMGLAGLAFLVGRLGAPGSALALSGLVAAAVLVDFGATANVVLGQRLLYALGAEYRSRLNGLYMATFFVGGAVGSALGGWAFARGGWDLAANYGLVLPVLALAAFAWHQRHPA